VALVGHFRAMSLVCCVRTRRVPTARSICRLAKLCAEGTRSRCPSCSQRDWPEGIAAEYLRGVRFWLGVVREDEQPERLTARWHRGRHRSPRCRNTCAPSTLATRTRPGRASQVIGRTPGQRDLLELRTELGHGTCSLSPLRRRCCYDWRGRGPPHMASSIMSSSVRSDAWKMPNFMTLPGWRETAPS